jgi:hypothetical protein
MFKVETPLSAVEDLIGCTGYVDRARAKIEARQEANRKGYPWAYSIREGRGTVERPGPQPSLWDQAPDLTCPAWAEYVPAYEQGELPDWEPPDLQRIDGLNRTARLG